MRKPNRIGQEGFTLVEILVALAVLLVTALAFTPLFVYISEASQANRTRFIAAELAAGVLEQIRGLPSGRIGVQGGNPGGPIPHEQVISRDGRTFTVRTDIWWVDDPSDGTAEEGTDPIPYDYKQVRVSVSAPGLFTGQVVRTAEFRSLASLEGEEEAFPGGNILAKAQRGWQTTPGEPVPVADVKVELTAGPDAPQTLWTDERGKALFAILDAGTYTVEADARGAGMMVRPDQVRQSVGVAEGITVPVVFEVEKPCHLNVRLIDALTGAPITAGGDATLTQEIPYGDVVRVSFTPEMNGFLGADLWGDLWPVGEGYPGAYRLEVRAEGYRPVEPPEVGWDGTFDAPGETKEITVRLWPSSRVEVRDAATGEPLIGARVEIFLHTWTYSQGGWSEACSGEPVDSGVTGGDGRVHFRLKDNVPPPPEPEEGDTYTLYCVRVAAAGYESRFDHGAFRVEGGLQKSGGTEIDVYTVSLEPVPPGP
jgi:prepilin-type N-terminal cleavage/methylation domain-containing protein